MPKIAKDISSHLISGVFSRKFRKSSILSISLPVDVHPMSNSTRFRSTREWKPEIAKLVRKQIREKNFNQFFFICMESNDISNNKKYGTL